MCFSRDVESINALFLFCIARNEVRFVMGSDPPLEKQTPYARGAYVKLQLAGKLVEVLDSFFWWRHAGKIGGVFPAPKIALLKGRDIALSTDCEYECDMAVENAPTRVDVPFSPLAIPGPAWSKKHASVKIEHVSDDFVQVRFEGDTISFRANFATVGVPGRYETPDGDPLPEDMSLEQKKSASFVRIIKKWDVSVEEQRAYLVELINETIYENTLVVVEWLGEIKETSAVGELKKSIAALDNVYAYK